MEYLYVLSVSYTFLYYMPNTHLCQPYFIFFQSPCKLQSFVYVRMVIVMIYKLKESKK